MARQAASERQLIINADDLGWTTGTNEAIFRLMAEGSITSASAMMPCTSAAETLARMRSASLGRVGVHLTLTSGATRSERPVFRQHPLPGLTDEDGCFHRDAARAELDADPEEVRFELEAQIAGVTICCATRTFASCSIPKGSSSPPGRTYATNSGGSAKRDGDPGAAIRWMRWPGRLNGKTSRYFFVFRRKMRNSGKTSCYFAANCRFSSKWRKVTGGFPVIMENQSF
ncbi:ChbG/HpnK family deacetylase [Paenibacillus cymbidii]|uniref:ChbG/HpnK family deacetylase n=1 Tax=Paenibacillus cymbidii TaxID=1639034 RepID=UPI00108138FF|nr:ChbG/HpnK family deacetylase [Paenibacillus cymbidii]